MDRTAEPPLRRRRRVPRRRSRPRTRRPPRIERVSFPSAEPGVASAARAEASSACTPTTRTTWRAVTTSWGDGSPNGSSRCTPTQQRAPRRGDRPGHELVPAAGPRAGRRRQRPNPPSSRATWSSRGSGEVSTRPAGSSPRRIARTERRHRAVLPSRPRALRAESDPGRCHVARSRDAANRDDFADVVRRRGRLELEVIDGRRTRRRSRSSAGRAASTRGDGPFLVLDIGGGSTEFVLGREPAVTEHAISTQMGSVRLTERYDPPRPPAPEDLDGASDAEVDGGIEAGGRGGPGRRGPDVRRGRRDGDHAPGDRARARPLRPGSDPPHVADARRGRAGPGPADRHDERRARGDPGDGARPRRRDRRRRRDPRWTSMRRFGFERTLVSETDILDGLAFEALGVR